MAELPVSAEQFFRDFSFDLTEWTVERGGAKIATVKGLANSDENGRYLGMLHGCDVRPGDRLIGFSAVHHVSRVEVDTFGGIPSLVKAYY